MEYSIVDVSSEHIASIEELEKLCFSSPWNQEQLKKQMKDHMHEFIAAISDDGSVLGYVGMMYVLDEGYIANVAVSPEYRRKGIADRIINELCLICDEHKLSFVTLEVRASNETAISVYRKLEFREVGRRKNYYRNPREDALILRKEL